MDPTYRVLCRIQRMCALYYAHVLKYDATNKAFAVLVASAPNTLWCSVNVSFTCFAQLLVADFDSLVLCMYIIGVGDQIFNNNSAHTLFLLFVLFVKKVKAIT